MFATHHNQSVMNTKTNQERLIALFEENGLLPEDMFKLRFKDKNSGRTNIVPIVMRTGIDKIQAKQNIRCSFELIYHSDDLKTAVIKAVGVKGNTFEQTYGEVNPKNCTSPYPIAVAEKRARSRIVLKLAGFYAEGAYGEDEMKHEAENGD